jgi:hypothetical protein
VEEAVFVLSSVVALLALAVIGLFALLQQTLRQHGRLLERIEALEGPGSHRPPAGLAVGTTVPPFSLPDAVGRLVGPENFRGKRVLLVQWDPESAGCALIAPDLAAIQPDSLVLLSYRDVESNRRFAAQYDLRCPILHLDGSPPLEIFPPLGTPVAYLLDEEGRIAESLAVGAKEVQALAWRLGTRQGVPA